VLQPGADEASGQGFQAAILQIHGKEGRVRDDVDQAEGFVEFDAVEQRDLTVKQGDVSQVDITMTFANETLGLALCQQRFESFEATFGPVLQCIELLQVGLIRE
jgi:hypothetical protein